LNFSASSAGVFLDCPLSNIWERTEKSIANKVHEQKKGKGPLVVGLLNGLMPCGPLQSMQLYALSTGSALWGALSMFLFSTGTVPLMFGLGALSSLLSKKFTGKMMKVSAYLVVILGVFMFTSGLSLSGVDVSSPIAKAGASGTGSAGVAVLEDGVQTVTTKLSWVYGESGARSFNSSQSKSP
jgi:sulfite exporter TauE/SafE